MTWYFHYQRAGAIALENERRAELYRILKRAEEQAAADDPRAGRSALRRAIGWAVISVGHGTTRLGGLVIRIGHALDGAGATPTA